MASNDYHFITHWRVQGSVPDVHAILGDAGDLARWWPSVYLNVQVLEPGDALGVGKVVNLHTKGWLPYTLHWQFHVTDSHAHGFSLDAVGDFEGRGIWTFVRDGPWVDITYDWRVRAGKPLLRRLSFIMKPIFSANHYWAMAQGEESLRLELARRSARTAEERKRIAAPPGPTSVALAPLLMGAAAFGGTALYLARRRKHTPAPDYARPAATATA